MPGLVNGHQHSNEHFQRGRAENLPLELWMQLVRPRVPVPLTPRQVYLRTMIGAIESLRTGCTTLVDDFPQAAGIDRGAVDAALQAYDDAGIRALLGFGMMDRALIDSLPFVDELVPAELAAQLRAAPRTSAEQFEALMRELAAARHPHAAPRRRAGLGVGAAALQRGLPGAHARARRRARAAGDLARAGDAAAARHRRSSSTARRSSSTSTASAS